MARKSRKEEHVNHERWLVSYADFITLLFAFFVVMYAISSLNEGKYRVLSNALVTAFSQPSKTIAPIQQGQKIRSPIIQQQQIAPTFDQSSAYQGMPGAEEIAKMQKLADELLLKLQTLADKDYIKINKTTEGVEIDINSKLLFLSGNARLSRSAVVVIKEIAKVLKSQSNQIKVEGHTDDLPIQSLVFPSNWELSAARAASVVRVLSANGIDPLRLRAIGFGKHKPIETNKTVKGRAANRRVSILVLNRTDKIRRSLKEADIRNRSNSNQGANRPSTQLIQLPFSNRDSGLGNSPEEQAGSNTGVRP